MSIKRGDLVEFSDRHYHNYPPADPSLIRYGVAIEDARTDNSPVRVETADGSIFTARYIYASGWAGWMPEDLESVYERINVDTCDEWEGE